MQRVAILGLGLIGGSIGLGLSEWAEANKAGGKPALEITGFDTNLDHQGYAQKLKAVDGTAWDIVRAVANADFVIVAVPVLAMPELFQSIAPHLKPGAIVTDTGSTKTQVMRWAQEFLPDSIHFVGGHPMAGKTQSIEAASADLFKGATWCVSPAVSASEEAIRTVLGMIEALGAEPYFVDPAEHDAYVAGVSHLPFILSSALMTTVSQDSSWRDMKTLTSSGFRDVSRLASGGPEMHRDILMTNREAVTRWVNTMIDNLETVRGYLNSTSETANADLLAYLTAARDARAEWSVQTTREGELLQGTSAELAPEKFTEHMGRMFLGGFARRKKPDEAKNPNNSTPR